MVPIENSTEGVVSHTLDRLIDSELLISGEVQLEIHHYLLSRAPDLAEVKEVVSHPQALAQCREWVDKNLPNAQVVELGSTAAAAERALDDPRVAAIATRAGRPHLWPAGPPASASRISPTTSPASCWSAAVRWDRPDATRPRSCFSIKDEVGTLYRILEPLATRAGQPHQDRIASDAAAPVGVRFLRRLRRAPGGPGRPARPGGAPRAVPLPQGPRLVPRRGLKGRHMSTSWEAPCQRAPSSILPPTSRASRSRRWSGSSRIAGVIKLASNENPFPPPPGVLQAIRQVLGGLNRYPDGSGYYLRHALAKRHGVSSDAIVLGNGSNELPRADRPHVRPSGRGGRLPAPLVRGVSPSIVQSVGGIRVVVTLKDHRIDLATMARAITPLTKLVFIANPNNPTGTIVTAEEVERFLRRRPRAGHRRLRRGLLRLRPGA